MGALIVTGVCCSCLFDINLAFSILKRKIMFSEDRSCHQPGLLHIEEEDQCLENRSSHQPGLPILKRKNKCRGKGDQH